MRPQSGVGFGENIYKLKNADKATFYIPIEARVMPAPTSKKPKERKFVVDSGASVHMMSKKDLSSDEYVGYFAEIQELHSGANGQWRSANKRKHKNTFTI